MEHAAEQKTLNSYVGQEGPAQCRKGIACTDAREACTRTAVQLSKDEVHAVVYSATQHPSDACHWSGAPVSASAHNPMQRGKKLCAVTAVSPPELSLTSLRSSAELLHMEQRAEEPASQLCSTSGNGGDIAENGCLPQSSNAGLGSQASTVSPRDFLSSPPTAGVAGLPLWREDTPTAAAVAMSDDRRGGAPTFCRPLQSPSLSGMLSMHRLGGIPIVPAGGGDSASLMEGSQQQGIGVSPQGEGTSEKFFFSAPFTTPLEPSTVVASSGLFGGFAAPSAQPLCSEKSFTGAEVAAAMTSSPSPNVGKKLYMEKSHSNANHPGSAPRVCNVAVQDACFAGHMQADHAYTPRPPEATKPLSRSAIIAGTAGEGGVPTEGRAGSPKTAIGSRVAAMRGMRTQNMKAAFSAAAAAAAAASNTEAVRERRMQRGVRPAAKSAISRCNRRGSRGAAAVVTGALVNSSAPKNLENNAASGETAPAVDATSTRAKPAARPTHTQSLPAVPPHLRRSAAPQATGSNVTHTGAAAAGGKADETTEVMAAIVFPLADSVARASGTNAGAASPVRDDHKPVDVLSFAGVAAAEKKEEIGVVQTRTRSAEALHTDYATTHAGQPRFKDIPLQKQRLAQQSEELAQMIKRRKTAKALSTAAATARSVASLSETFAAINDLSQDNTSGANLHAQAMRQRGSRQCAKMKPFCVDRAVRSSVSARRLQQTRRRLLPQGGSRLATAGVRSQARALTEKNSSIGRRRRQPTRKKTVEGGQCPQMTGRRLEASTCSGLRSRRSSSAVTAGAVDGGKSCSEAAGASTESCAAPLASANSEISDEDLEAAGESAQRLKQQGAAANPVITVPALPTSSSSVSSVFRFCSSCTTLLKVGASSNTSCDKSCIGGGVAAATAASPELHRCREYLQQYQQRAFYRCSTTGSRASPSGPARAAPAIPAGSAGAAGGLSEKIRLLVEKVMMSKHKIVWIDRSEAKAFLPLPGMQEEKVYLVWTEKGIDVLVDLQAYIPCTHCPIIMSPKQRRGHIPLLILSSTSLSLLFSHVCRRTATTVFRLPLTRTPPAYRRSMLQMLRGEKLKHPQRYHNAQRQQRNTPEEEQQQQQPGTQPPQESQRWRGAKDQLRVQDGSVAARAQEVSEQWRSRPAADGNRVLKSRCSTSASAEADELPHANSQQRELAGDSLQSPSPCSTSAGSTGPSSTPTPPAADNAFATSSAADAAACTRSFTCAAGVMLQKVAAQSAAPLTKIIEQKDCSEFQQQQHRDQAQQEEQRRITYDLVYSDRHGRQDTGRPLLPPAATGNALEDARSLPTVSPCYRSDSVSAENATTAAHINDKALQKCEEEGTREHEILAADKIMRQSNAAVSQATVEVTAATPRLSAMKGGGADTRSPAARLCGSRCVSPSRNSVKKGSAEQKGLITQTHAGIAAAAVLSAQFFKSNEEEASESGIVACKVPDRKKVLLDMKDFYCCSQGKVVGEDYVYFRQTLPDDEGADVYDLTVNVKKRPKKTFFRKPRSAAFWSLLAKRSQRRLPEEFSAGKAASMANSDGNRCGNCGTAHVVSPAKFLLNLDKSEPSSTSPSFPGVLAEEGPVASVAFAKEFRKSAPHAPPQFTTEYFLRLLAQPAEATGVAVVRDTRAIVQHADNADDRTSTWKGSKWAYVEEYGDEGLDERLHLPLVFSSEMRVLLGFAASPTPHRCNMSLASHRVTGAVHRRLRMFLCDGEKRGEEIAVYANDTDATAEAKAGMLLEGVQQTPPQEKNAGRPVEAETPASPEQQKRESMRMVERFAQKTNRGLPSDCQELAEKKESAGETKKGLKRLPESACKTSPAACDTVALAKERRTAESVPVVRSTETRDCENEEEDPQRAAAQAHREEGKELAKEDAKTGAHYFSDPEDGTLVEVQFPTEFVQYYETDRVRLYGRRFLTRSLQILADVGGLCSGADLSAVNMAQYAPNLFWNVVRFSGQRENLDNVLQELCPAVATLRRRRKRLEVVGESLARARKVMRQESEGDPLQEMISSGQGCSHRLFPSELRYMRKGEGGGTGGAEQPHAAADGDEDRVKTGARRVAASASAGSSCAPKHTGACSSSVCGAAAGAAGPLVRQRQREERRQKELELRFQEMKIEFDERARRMISRREALKNDIICEAKWSKKPRVPAFPENDDAALVSAVIDPEEGILKWPLSAMTMRQKNVIYQASLQRDLTACIRLSRLPGKGRAVFAADRILKDDFVVEYKGELCSERAAREREQRYNRSKVPMGSFMFYFKNGSRTMAIDATDEKQDFGPARLINHSRRNPNMTPRAILINEQHGEPRLIFVARRNIEKGEELLVDYGERDPEVIRDHPWLNS